MLFRPPTAACVLSVALSLVSSAAAQETSLPVAASPAAATAQPQAGNLDVDRLPIDLQRIERQLRQSTTEREAHEGLRLRYFVDVYGKTPRIELFAPDENLNNGPTPWGAPTHKDMLDVMTPKEFRTPIMDFNALMRWLSDRVSK